MEDLNKSTGILGITFDEITVEVEVLGVTTKTKFFRAVLVNPVEGATVKATADIVDGNKCQYDIGGKLKAVADNIPGQKHTGVNAIRFTGMDPIIYKDHSFVLLVNCCQGRVAVLFRYNY